MWLQVASLEIGNFTDFGETLLPPSSSTALDCRSVGKGEAKLYQGGLQGVNKGKVLISAINVIMFWNNMLSHLHPNFCQAFRYQGRGRLGIEVNAGGWWVMLREPPPPQYSACHSLPPPLLLLPPASCCSLIPCLTLCVLPLAPTPPSCWKGNFSKTREAK